MKCFFCGGKMKLQKTSYSVNRKNYHLVLDDVPAFVCRQCGEPYFGEKEVKIIEDLVKEADHRTAQISQLEVSTK
ncbi:MAG: type II toxin-antitoxin system MqsA family antitoxin [Candidatus Ratteibacteria bacterium]|nr:type II toxin-antitoxin system MqsA family antitoxin [Candidatus Ratteibacteria bacterium]